MVFVHVATGRLIEAAAAPPDRQWEAVPGSGPLVRRRERDRWQAAHVFGGDLPLWLARGWERVFFRDALPALASLRGKASGVRVALAPPTPAEARSARKTAAWVVLGDEPGSETPAERPGAQALFPLDELRQGVPAARLAESLLAGRIRGLGLRLEPSLWVLRGPPVSPADAATLRKLGPILALAERLSEDLAQAAAAIDPALLTPPPERLAAVAPGAVRPRVARPRPPSGSRPRPPDRGRRFDRAAGASRPKPGGHRFDRARPGGETGDRPRGFDRRGDARPARGGFVQRGAPRKPGPPGAKGGAPPGANPGTSRGAGAGAPRGAKAGAPRGAGGSGARPGPKSSGAPRRPKDSRTPPGHDRRRPPAGRRPAPAKPRRG